MTAYRVRRLAVLGAGVMGAQIAAQCANAGIETYLYDLPSDSNDKNAIVNQALKNLLKLNPSPLATKNITSRIHAKNYGQHLADLSTCDLIVEAIAEKMEWKADLYNKIAPYVNDSAILASNTSGLSITALAKLLPDSLQSRFCGVHFFNPPRYMHLVEIIPHHSTSMSLMDDLETFLVSDLGKGVVRAKDTPNFVANRIGVFSLLTTVHHATQMNIGFDVVDALTGSLIGRPKSATFRTMDVVGLDTMGHVVNTMTEQLTDDPWQAYFKLPDWLNQLIEQGALGQKTRGGIYKKQGKVIQVLDVKTGEYRDAVGKVDDQVKEILLIKNSKERFAALCNSNNPQAKFLAACFKDLFHYCAYHLADIADTVRDVDLAIRWGFGWQQGPFEQWQAAGLTDLIQMINADIGNDTAMANVALPAWLNDCSDFYQSNKAYSATDNQFHARADLAVYQRQYFPDSVLGESYDKGVTVYEDDGVRLWHQNDDVAILSFKSKVGSISNKVVDGMLAAIDIAEKDFQAMVVYQSDAMNFSAGADLKLFAEVFAQGDFAAVGELLTKFQHAVMRFKYSSIPVVAALRGRALGGGCEVVLHCDKVVAGFESYIGLVEIGVGLLPAGGGCKEMALRAATENRNSDPFVALESYYRSIAMADVSASAIDAKAKGYMRASDVVLMNNYEVLYVAKQVASTMVVANYRPPVPALFKVCGRDGAARFKVLLANMLEGHFISDYDYFVASKIADVISGGDVAKGQLVDEAWILKLEVEAFMQLAAKEKTMDRIKHLLKTGKPLRN